MELYCGLFYFSDSKKSTSKRGVLKLGHMYGYKDSMVSLANLS